MPELVSEKDILGAVHVHTTDSDGAASLDAMADAAAALGWSLLGIADHSQAAAYAHGLDAARLRAQGEAIAARNARGGTPLVLRGTEADILADGALDLPEDVPLDFVVASVHSSFRQSREAQTARLVRAVSRGPGTILGHPTGRLLLAREGYQVDLEAVLQAAAASGAAVEINAHPFRLDLDWRWVRRAVALGVPISVGPDAHEPAGLADVRWGVGIARKGWATARRRAQRPALAVVAVKQSAGRPESGVRGPGDRTQTEWQGWRPRRGRARTRAAGSIAADRASRMTSAAASISASSTSRWVTKRTVCGPSSRQRTPRAASNFTTSTARRPQGRVSANTMLVSTAARSTARPGAAARRSASLGQRRWSSARRSMLCRSA